MNFKNENAEYFANIDGRIEDKYEEYKSTCEIVQKKSKEVGDESVKHKAACLSAEDIEKEIFYGEISQNFFNFTCNIKKKAYKSLVNHKILGKVVSNKKQVDNCFKSSWNKLGKSHFCG